MNISLQSNTRMNPGRQILFKSCIIPVWNGDIAWLWKMHRAVQSSKLCERCFCEKHRGKGKTGGKVRGSSGVPLIMHYHWSVHERSRVPQPGLQTIQRIEQQYFNDMSTGWMFQVECQIREAHERNTVPFAQTNVRNGAGYTNEPGLNCGNVRNT